MHLFLACAAVVSAIALRLLLDNRLNCLFRFSCAPLILLSTTIALLLMGNQGSMFGKNIGILSTTAYGGACLYLMISVSLLVARAWQAWISLKLLKKLTPATWQGHSFLLLDTEHLVAAQVGWWRSQLVLSRGLLNQLDTVHLQAIVYHESAHSLHRDTFWFFWWGWLRQITAWLPKSQLLWEELLLDREIRADRWASRHCDYLVLAESLVCLAQDRYQWQAFLCASASDRLTQRINLLLNNAQQNDDLNLNWQMYLCGLGFIPLLIIPLHNYSHLSLI